MKNGNQLLLYPKDRTVTKEKKKDMMDLLTFISPSKHDYYRNLRINWSDGTLDVLNEEDVMKRTYVMIIIYVDGSI